MNNWNPSSWRDFPIKQQPTYTDLEKLKKVETPLMSESDCDKYFDTLKSKSIKMQTVYDKLLNDGLDSFKVSFRDLLSKLIN